MANGRMLELGYTDKQIAVAAAAWISIQGDAEINWPKFRTLTGYSTQSSAARQLRKYRAEIRDVDSRIELLSDENGGNSKAATIEYGEAQSGSSKRRATGATGVSKAGKPAKKQRVAKGEKGSGDGGGGEGVKAGTPDDKFGAFDGRPNRGQTATQEELEMEEDDQDVV